MKPLTTCIIQINLYEFGARLTSPLKIMSICNQIFCKEIFNRKLWSYIKLTQLVKIDVLKKARILTQSRRGEKDSKKRILFGIWCFFPVIFERFIFIGLIKYHIQYKISPASN